MLHRADQSVSVKVVKGVEGGERDAATNGASEDVEGEGATGRSWMMF